MVLHNMFIITTTVVRGALCLKPILHYVFVLRFGKVVP